MAYVLAAFDFSKARDEGGNEIEPEMSFAFSLTSHLLPFKCSIRPRSAQAVSLITADH